MKALLGFVLLALTVIIAGVEGGPKVVGESRGGWFVGSSPVEDPSANPKCNARELYKKKCEHVKLPPNGNLFSCGDDYDTIKPVASGGIKNKRFENDKVVCSKYLQCSEIFDMKASDAKCDEVQVP